MAIFKVYIDESVTKDERIFGTAACVATLESWADLEARWIETLVKHRVPLTEKDRPYGRPSFHAADFENGQAQFLGWGNAQKVPCMTDLVGVVTEYLQKWFGITLLLTDLVPEPGDTPKKMRRLAYMRCFVALLDQLADYLADDAEGAAVICEQNDAVTGAAANWFARFKMEQPPRRFGNFTFADRLEDVPLQAADLCAYEAGRAGERLWFTGGIGGRDFRMSGVRLMTKPLIDGVDIAQGDSVRTFLRQRGWDADES